MPKAEPPEKTTQVAYCLCAQDITGTQYTRGTNATTDAEALQALDQWLAERPDLYHGKVRWARGHRTFDLLREEEDQVAHDRAKLEDLRLAWKADQKGLMARGWSPREALVLIRSTILQDILDRQKADDEQVRKATGKD